MKNLTIFGVWLFLFPVQIIIVTVAVALEYAIAMFNMPTDLWEDLHERLNDIHIEDEE